MEEFIIENSEKGFLAARESAIKNIKEGWKKIFKDCSKDEAVLLENIISHKTLLENGATGDIGGYDGFALSIVRRVFANLIAKDLVSVQPIYTPTGKVFYLDPQVTTGLTENYQSMFDSHYDSKNYDVSKGEYTLSSGSTTAITESNYNSGLTFDIAYSGGSDGLSSIGVIGRGNSYSDMVLLNGSNVTLTTGWVGTFGLFNNAGLYDNSTLAAAITLVVGTSGYVKTQFSVTPSNPLTRYSFYFEGGNNATNWKLCGSTDNTNWTLLDNRNGESPVSNSYNYYIPTDISTPYQYYLLTGITNSGGGVQIQEIELMSGSSFEQYMNFALSPQTWTSDLISQNKINIMAHQTGSSFSSTISAFTEWKTYTGLEGVSGMQEVKLNVVSSDVSVRTRKIRGKVTEELLQDAEAYFNMNALNELAELAGEEIAAEIDREIISSLINIAPYKSEWYYDMYATTAMTGFVTGNASSEIASAVTQYRWAQDSLLTAINKMDTTLKKANIYHGANWLICSAKVGAVIETMKEHKAISGSKIVRVDKLRKTGKLKSSINVYVDPYLPDNICLLGYNGTNWDSGYIYAPYVIASHSFARDPETLFEINSQFLTRYATKIVTNKKYGLIDCRFPTSGPELIVNGV